MVQTQNLLSLKSDWVFKRIFGKEGNEDILADLLSSILNIEIQKIELRNTELLKNKEEQKKSILDIKAILNDNTIMDIELQVRDENNITERGIQYLTKLYSEQLENGEKYTDTKKAIVIIILNFNYYKVNTYHSIAHLKFEPCKDNTYIKLYDEEESTMTDKLEIHVIELPKFLKHKNKEESKLAEWLMLLSGKGELIEMALSKNAQKIKKAYEELEYLSQDKAAREEYDAYQRAIIDEKMKIQYAEEKGIEHGMTIGKSEGKKEKSIEIAKKMINKGTNRELIKEFTGLTEKEIIELQNDKE